jgi:DNA-binding response OmpR family regulator
MQMNRILIVDDEDHIRILYKDYFTREGFQVATAASGEEALEMIKKQKFDLIVLDIELDEASGLDILRRFKEEFPTIPVVLNSAYSVYKSDFHTWVADGYILKSSDMQPLKEKVRELVKT